MDEGDGGKDGIHSDPQFEPWVTDSRQGDVRLSEVKLMFF